MKAALLEQTTQIDSRSFADAVNMSGTDALFAQPGWLGGATVAFGAYAIGCFTTGYYLVRWRTGQDIRALGTGSCGSRNVSRVLGSKGFVLTLVGDLAKGALAVWLAQRLTGDQNMALLALIAVTIGHVWPVQLGFRGGKGIAASLSGLLQYDPFLTGVYLLLFGAGFSLTHRSVGSSLVAYALLPLASFLAKQDTAHVCGVAVLAALVAVAHSQNIAGASRALMLRRRLAQSDL